ncbi:unnamed protein product [Toxocara canis]|uniref:DUF2575 domain-containing protein n=1 Tax=Toxocara canis TaxID=6265 RepID=A0A183UAU0_TOXCA|nr:unnamed protein product [Toxocara canis]
MAGFVVYPRKKLRSFDIEYEDIFYAWQLCYSITHSRKVNATISVHEIECGGEGDLIVKWTSCGIAKL